MQRTLIQNILLVNEGKVFPADVLIEGEYIAEISNTPISAAADTLIDGRGKYLFPGLIDDQVHFREPGLTHKADIHSESRAALAGGITSFMDMPNTVPNTLTQALLEEKYVRASETSLANYSFFMGASNDNIQDVLETDPLTVCGVKIFMGSSTGNMLVDNKASLETIFSKCKLLIATHCEDEGIIRQNTALYVEKYGEEIPVSAHPLIRSEEACFKSSSFAAALARKHDTRLHILHISTAKELQLFDNTLALKDKRLTAEACIHHLWFSEEDYKTKGNLIKWNPAVKTKADREAILQAVSDNRIDVIATDHAPHTKAEKAQTYLKAPSGGPLVQHSLVTLLELYKQNKITLEKIVEKTSHAVAECFRIEKRGYIRKGYFADLVIADLNSTWTVSPDNIYSKCGWSPFEGQQFSSQITHTFVNGTLVYTQGKFKEDFRGKRLLFHP
jgi:dihydroorotase